MNKKVLTDKIIKLVLGTLIISLGIAMQIKADIGVSPISSLPYVISLSTPNVTVGNWLLIWNSAFTFLQWLVLGKAFKKIYLLQIPLAFLIGYGTDFSKILLTELPVETYGARLLCSLTGVAVTSFGGFLTVSANLLMNGPEAFVNAIAVTKKMEFSYLKVAFDIALILIAAIVSFGLYHSLAGIREGTVLSAVLTGLFVRLNKKIFVEKRFFGFMEKKSKKFAADT